MPKSLTTPPQSMSEEILKQLDVIMVIDRSGSMNDPSLRFKGKSKWQELQEDTTAIAREMAKYDADGLTVIAFSSAATVKDNVTPDTVAQLFAEHNPRGSTNLAAALGEATTKARASAKQTLVLVHTDGRPDSEEEAVQIINKAAEEFGRERIGFCFVQVGDDNGAAQFLDRLDNDLQHDICATVSAKDAENLTAGQLAWLAFNA